MASLKEMRGKWYAYITKGTGLSRKFILVPLRTNSKVTARQRFSKVESAEPDIKSGVITDIKAFFSWLNKEHTSKVVVLVLKDAVEQWIESQKANGKRPRTVDINETALQHFIRMCGSNYPVEKICIGDIKKFREVHSPQQRHAATTTNMYLRSIGTFLSWLVEQELIEKKPKVVQLDIDEPEVKYFSEPEIADLLGLDLSKENADRNGTWVENWEHYRRAFQFYLNTGCRLREPFVGEINGMWLDVPPNKSKNRRKRTIHLDINTLETVKEMRGRVAKCLNLKWATDQYTKNLRVACRVLDIKEKRTVHSLRHTYGCIRRLQTNGNMPLIRDEMGHTNIATTERYCNIPLKRLEDDFPSYTKQAKNGDVDTDYVDTEPVKMGVAPR